MTVKRKTKSAARHGLQHKARAQADLKFMARSLRAKRLRYGYSLNELADEVGCSVGALNKVEYAQNFPSMPVYFALCRTLDFRAIPFL